MDPGTLLWLHVFALIRARLGGRLERKSRIYGIRGLFEHARSGRLGPFIGGPPYWLLAACRVGTGGKLLGAAISRRCFQPANRTSGVLALAKMHEVADNSGLIEYPTPSAEQPTTCRASALWRVKD